MHVTEDKKVGSTIENEYDKLVLELKRELPGIILPSMGMLDDVDRIDIDGKDYIISDSDKEE